MNQSPNRATYMTQKREARNSTIHKYPNLSQKSPIIHSPNLNEQTQSQSYQFKGESRIFSGEMKNKLDLLLKHNSQLLNENATLSEMVNTYRIEIETRNKKQENDVCKTNQELNKIVSDMKQSHSDHEAQIEKLLHQISKLHDENHELEIQKNNDLKKQQETQERQMVHHIAQIKRSQDDGKSLMELQIKKLKEVIEMKQFEYDSLKSQSKSEIQQYRSQIQVIESEIDHQKKLKDLDLGEMVRRNKDDMRSALKHLQLEFNIEIKQHQNKITKLKKDLTNKDVEIEHIAKKSSGENEEIYYELSSIKKQKQYLLDEMQHVSQQSYQRITKEKERVEKLAELEKQNMKNLFESEKESLVGQKEKLMVLCIHKSEEIRRLYENINNIKITSDAERQQLSKTIEGLRQNLKQSQRGNLEDLELLKIKMAHLHEADIKSLESFYENQVSSLHKQNNTLKDSHSADREQIYRLLHENDETRKKFEVEVSKQKSKIQDMKVKFAAARLEFKEQITSLGTKMQLTSQTLVRETDQKQKGAEFFEAQKRKFYNIIQSKDKQIQQIHQTMISLKEINEQEITTLKSQIGILRDTLISKQNEFKDFKVNLQQEFQRKSMKIIQQSTKVNPDQQITKENHELKGKLTQFEKDNFKKQKQIDFLTRQTKSLQQQLGLRAGFIETMQLQSSAAIEDEKQKLKILFGKNEVAMKDYYEVRLANREEDNEAIKRQLGEKDKDLREVIEKYHHLERKLKELLEAQDKLSEFETKMINLGLDQNLVKNMAELFIKNK